MNRTIINIISIICLMASSLILGVEIIKNGDLKVKVEEIYQEAFEEGRLAGKIEGKNELYKEAIKVGVARYHPVTGEIEWVKGTNITNTRIDFNRVLEFYNNLLLVE